MESEQKEAQGVDDGEKARAFLSGVLERMQIPAEVAVEEAEDKYVLTIDCEYEDDTQRVIGRRGQVVDALQHLSNKVISKGRVGRGKMVLVDTDGYRQRHVERLEGLALRMAEKAKKSGSPIDLSPMSAYDRRIVHMTLADLEGVATHSEGEGDDRHVVVVPE